MASDARREGSVIELHSRTVTVTAGPPGPGQGRREIRIHEVTEEELKRLETRQIETLWIGVVMFLIGAGASLVLWSMRP